jgi:molecular chaperone GrpE
MMKEEKIKIKVKEDLKEERKALSEKMADKEVHKEKDAPSTKMTKTELLKKIEELQESAKKNYDLYMRSQADIDNVKKRFQKEKEELAKYSNELLIKQLLPVIDSLKKAIDHSQDEKSTDALREGVELTLKGLIDALEKAGLEKVKAVGEPFDPNFHESISEQEDNTKGSRIVLKELQNGYILNQRLIRPAMVIINKNKDELKTNT